MNHLSPFSWESWELDCVLRFASALNDDACQNATDAANLDFLFWYQYDQRKWEKSDPGKVARGIYATERGPTWYHRIDELHEGARHILSLAWYYRRWDLCLRWPDAEIPVWMCWWCLGVEVCQGVPVPHRYQQSESQSVRCDISDQSSLRVKPYLYWISGCSCSGSPSRV